MNLFCIYFIFCIMSISMPPTAPPPPPSLPVTPIAYVLPCLFVRVCVCVRARPSACVVMFGGFVNSIYIVITCTGTACWSFMIFFFSWLHLR